MGSADDQVNWLVPIGTMASTCLIATPLTSAMLKRELSSISWVVNWVISGVASCAGGVVIFHMTLLFGAALLSFPSALSDPMYFGERVLFAALIGLVFSLMIGVVIAIESGAVALLLAPLALLARRLILRRISPAEPAGGESQTQA